MTKQHDRSTIVNKILLAASVAAAAVALGGCAATQTGFAHKDLIVQSNWVSPIHRFLPPDPSQQTVYVSFRNASDKALDSSALEQEIDAELTQHGYRIEPYASAHFLLQITVEHIDRVGKSASNNATTSALGGAAVGAAAGRALAGGSSQSRNSAALGAAVVGAAVGLIADAVVKNVVYKAVTDVQIGERDPSNRANHGWDLFENRLISTANRTNLKFQDALPTLQAQMVHNIGNLL